MCYCEAALCGDNDENDTVGELARFFRECKVECNVAAIGAIMWVTTKKDRRLYRC